MSLKTSEDSFARRLEINMADSFMRKAVAGAQERMFNNRAQAADKLGHWDEWRSMGAAIRDHVLENLDTYLYQLSERVEANGGHVFFAQTGEQAREYIDSVIKETEAQKVVKSKSMVTEEIGLNAMLEAMGCEVLETDLGEYILQLDDDKPSHIVVPALHKNREQIRQVFEEKLGYTGPAEPEQMTRFVREHIRKAFLEADVGITGCNFAVAESGSVALVTNEGNARFATTLPKTHIAVMGMERIVPTFKELDILVSLLCRSAVGLPLTGYVTLLTGPRENGEIDGPENFHLVIVDNGRSEILGSEFRPILRCIRCAACINTCPAYRHIGGHAYGSIYPGPIGAVLSPLLGGYKDYKELPYACSLCKGCNDVCPVQIPLAELLNKHRQVMAESKFTPLAERATVGFFNWINARPNAWNRTVNTAAPLAKKLIHNGRLPINPGPIGDWVKSRDLPEAEGQSFREWFRNRSKTDTKGEDA